ncbi:MAG: DUF2069 domain-containing protein [Agarilytica sp.]
MQHSKTDEQDQANTMSTNNTDTENDTSSAKQRVERKARISVITHYVLFAMLIGLFIYWNAIRDGGFKPGVFLFQTLPLLAFLPGMIKNNYRVYSWLCFIMLFYFIFAVQTVFTSTRTDSDFVFLALTVALFVSSMTSSRWLQRIQKGVF